MRSWIVLVLVAGQARADHDHAVDDDDGDAFGAAVTWVAAGFDTMTYTGNYQGVVPSLRWSNDRFRAVASGAFYRLEKNGASTYGAGDLVVHGQAVLLGNDDVRAGVVAGVSVPTGNEQRGFGMGHVMVMPALFGMWTIDRVAITATAGYSRAIGGDDAAHEHGAWPLVEPMNPSEITWSANSAVAVTSSVHAGARVSGGVPIGDGNHRLVGALRAGWASGRFATNAELQVGLAGDPFTLRGVVSTALSF